MRIDRTKNTLLLVMSLGFPACLAGAAIREENFDLEPANWEGVNNRNTHRALRPILTTCSTHVLRC